MLQATGRSEIVNLFVIFFFNDTATTEIYTLSLHDALPTSWSHGRTEAVASDPRSSTTRRSGARTATRPGIAVSRRPCGMRRPPPPSTRSGSTTPQALAPSATHTLSQIALPPAASSLDTSVDLPTPPGPASSATPRSPTVQAEACSGARPRVPAHHRAG